MTPEERAQKIADINRAQKISEIRAAQSKQAEPGVTGIGVTEGATPAAEDNRSLIQKGLSAGSTALQAGGKLLDVPRALVGGPLTAEALQKLTGKQAANWEEWGNGLNPTNLQRFPSSNEMMKRVGIPEGAKLSDYANIYAPKGSPWYMPEKGGALDPTLRGAGGFGVDVATDPLTYLSLGASAAAKAAAKQRVSVQVAEELARQNAGPLGKVTQAAGRGVENIGDVATALPQALTEGVDKSALGPAAISMANAPSKLVQWAGKKLYQGPVLGVEHEGAKYGKEGVANTLFDLGITSPKNLTEKTGEATTALMNARNKILEQAGQKGAVVPMSEATGKARQAVSDLRQIQDKDAHALADQLEAKLNEYHTTEAGVPAGPATTEQVPTGKYTDYMEPITEAKVTPGAPGIAPKPYTPSAATKLKTYLYNDLPTNIWGPGGANTPQDAIRKKLASGLKEGTENAIERVSPGQGATLAELNDEAGKLLSTQKSQAAAERQYDRLLSGPTGTTKVVGALKGPTAAALDVLGNVARAGQMSAGAKLRSLGEGRLTGPALDAYLRRKLIENTQGGQ